MQEINLYQKIDEQYMEMAGIEVGSPQLSYYDLIEEGEKDIILDDNATDVIELNKYESTWNPDGNDLRYKQEFTVVDPSKLFGKDRITDVANEIGIAVHLYSRESRFQETITLKDSIISTDKAKRIIFEKYFNKSKLRGVVNIEIFFYLKKLVYENPYQANEVGMKLSQTEIFKTRIIIDGEGSTFPITEVDNPKGPLWTIRKEWSDPSSDAFDITNVQVVLNRKHKAFKKLVQSNGPLTQELMSNIINQAMAMIISQAVADMNAQEESWDFDMAEEGSVLSVVKYWTEIFELDIDDSVMAIFSKIQMHKESSDEA